MEEERDGEIVGACEMLGVIRVVAAWQIDEEDEEKMKTGDSMKERFRGLLKPCIGTCFEWGLW